MTFTHRQLKNAIIVVLANYCYSVGPKEINAGLCCDFANAVFHTLNRPKDFTIANLSTDRGLEHCWMVHTADNGDLYHYDAECLDGTIDWTTLPFWQRNQTMLETPHSLDIEPI